MLRALAEEHGGRVVDFDEPAVRAAAADDPGLFVVGRRPVFIDEYQHVPEVLDSIKAELNLDGSPVQFVITGSTRFDSLPLAAQSLTGRLHRIEIHPLSQGETGDSRENLLESLFADASTVVTPQASATTRAEYANLIARGGFPPAQERTDSSRARWFDDYLALCLERDLLELGRVRQPGVLAPLLTRLAAQTAQILNMSQAGADIGLAANTTTDYVKLFESSFLVRLLPGWGKTLRASVASRLDRSLGLI
ncbi:MAG: AAA family ATPase [Acidimicrobiia bacterium]|nr:AAA family ATPase [Acidimicrobiia bacterium]